MSGTYETLPPNQQQVVYVIYEKLKEPPAKNYPPTRQGVHDYINDNGGKLVTDAVVDIGKAGGGAATTLIVNTHGPGVLKALEEILIRVLRK